MRYAKTLMYVAAFYVVPLVAQPELMLDPRILILTIFCAIVLLTQPDMTVDDTRDKRSTDGLSVLAILAACGIAQIGAVIEWAHVHRAPSPQPAWTIAGLVLLVGGTAIRLWAISTLGRFFTATVQTQDGQPVITSGPFRWVRHPSYLGAYMGVIGSAVLLHAPWTMIGGGIALAAAYAYRVTLEERTLRRELRGYREYQKSTARLVPMVW